MGEKLNFVAGGVGLLGLLADTVFRTGKDLQRIRSLRAKLQLDAKLTQAQKAELSSPRGKYLWPW